MTREEQVAELIRHKKEVQSDFGWNTTLLSSLDAAINALKQELCEDAISRQAILKLPKKTMKNYFGEVVGDVVFIEDIKALPPVIPKPKTGKWIDKKPNLQSPFAKMYWCDQCGAHAYKSAYCPGCGAKMEGEE